MFVCAIELATLVSSTKGIGMATMNAVEVAHLATKEDVANVRVEVAQLETRLLKWMFGLLLGIIVNVLGVAVSIVLQLM